MAGAQIEFLLTPFVDVNGEPLVGGIVKFFEAGTTTPVTIYSDSALTTAIGTQGILDSRGILEAFTDGAVLLKVEVYSGAVLLRTYDGLAYSGELSSTNLYYRRDGSLALTGDMNVAGYNFNNVGNVNLGASKRVFVNHGSVYSPVSTDQLVYGDGDATFRQYTQGGFGFLYKDATKLLTYDENEIKTEVKFNMNSKKITSLAAGTVSGDAVEYAQWVNGQSSQGAAITALEGDVAGLQTEIDDTQTGAGLGTDGAYATRTGTNYLDASTSLYGDGTLLDTQVGTNAANIGTNTTNISTFSGNLSTHIGNTGTAVHGLGTASTKTSVTSVGTPGTDTNIPTEKAVRDALTAGGAISAQDNDSAYVGAISAKTTIFDLTLTGKIVSAGLVHMRVTGSTVATGPTVQPFSFSALKASGSTDFTIKGTQGLTATTGTNSATDGIVTMYAERIDDNTIRFSTASSIAINVIAQGSAWA